MPVTPTTPYRFHEFYTPSHPPFEPNGSPWPTIVSEFIAPVFKDETDVLFWFLNHGPHFQLCIASHDYVRIEQNLETRRANFHINTKTPPAANATVATALGGSRWLADNRHGDPALAERRSELLVRTLHAACVLFIDQLVQKNSHWHIELNSDRNNPLGHSFESLFHLIGNLSQTEIEVSLFGATQLMKPAPGGKVRVQL